MFDILFGWRKATKCKKLIKRVQCRLKLLKNKRNSIVRQLRQDLAHLIESGYETIAFNRVEQLIKDQSTAEVYELLDNFCEFILINLSYIRRHKDCPNDINEAVSSLIFASARCGDLPELRVIRKLFGERYGQRFAMTALELSHGNLVNREIKEKLSMNSVPHDAKDRLVNEIARECSQKPEVLALEYYPGWQNQQIKESSGHQVLGEESRGPGMKASSVEEIQTKVIYADSVSTRKKILINLCKSLVQRGSGIAVTPATVQQSSLDVEEPSMHTESKKPGKVELNPLYKSSVSGLEHKEARKLTASSSESLPQFPEETVVYLDDIEEFQSPTKNDGDCQDQRLFKFKSPALPASDKIGIRCNQGNIDHYESWSDKSGSRSDRKRGKASWKRFRKVSVSRENETLNDMDCVAYYNKPFRRSPTHQPRKHQKKTPGVGRQQSYHAQKRPSTFLIPETNSSLRHPFYFCTCDDKHKREALPWKQKRGITASVGFPTPVTGQKFPCRECCHHYQLWNGELDKEIEQTTIPQKPRRRHDSGASVYNAFTYPHYKPNEQEKEKKGKENKSNSLSSNNFSDNVSCQRVTSSSARKETVLPYSRTETMPLERNKEDRKEIIPRSNSCPPRHLNHVHPKLPDYEDIAAKFMALKKDHLQTKGSGATANFA